MKKELEIIAKNVGESLGDVYLEILADEPKAFNTNLITDKMQPPEKLSRLLNPQCLSDYGISISLKELMSFDDGIKYLQNFYKKFVKNIYKRR